MEPRSLTRVFFSLAAVAGFPWGALMAVFFGAMSWWEGRTLSPGFLAVGFVGGSLAFGLGMAAALTPMNRDGGMTIEFEDRAAFMQQLDGALKKVGYPPAFLDDSYVVLHPSFKAGFLSGPLRLKFEQGMVRVLGPRTHLKALRKKLAGLRIEMDW